MDMKRVGSYIMSRKWLTSKGATINPKNKKDYKCFQYAIIISLNCQNIGNDPQIISKVKPFINQYNWRGIKFPSYQKHWKKIEQNNKTIALNVLFVPHNTKTIRLAYKSEYNNERENKVILLMITDGKKWHYLALKSEPIFDGGKWCNSPVKSLSKLLREKSSNHHGDFYCLNCFNSYSTKNRLKEHEEL